MPDDLLFLRELGRGLPDDQRLILCAFDGDPNTISNPGIAWQPRAWHPTARWPLPRHPLTEAQNAYIAVSAFKVGPDRKFRRKKKQFGSGLAFMIDDVGTKVPRELAQRLEPTVVIETSPGNEQWWYFMDEPVRDEAAFEHMIQAFIRQLPADEDGKPADDPGMASVTRIGRLPGL